MFFYMKTSYTCCQHLGPQIISLVNAKNQPNGKKRNHFFCCPFRMDYIAFKILIFILINQMHYLNIAKHTCMHHLSIKEN